MNAWSMELDLDHESASSARQVVRFSRSGFRLSAVDQLQPDPAATLLLHCSER
jgi:hypothetical protein